MQKVEEWVYHSKNILEWSTDKITEEKPKRVGVKVSEKNVTVTEVWWIAERLKKKKLISVDEILNEAWVYRGEKIIESS